MAPAPDTSGNSNDSVRRESQEFGPSRDAPELGRPQHNYFDQPQNVYTEEADLVGVENPHDNRAQPGPVARGSAADGAGEHFGYVEQIPAYERVADSNRDPADSNTNPGPTRQDNYEPPAPGYQEVDPAFQPRQQSAILASAEQPPGYFPLRTQTAGGPANSSRPFIHTHGISGQGFVDSPASLSPASSGPENGNPLGASASKTQPSGYSSNTSGPVSSFSSMSSGSTLDSWRTARTHQSSSSRSPSPGGQKRGSR